GLVFRRDIVALVDVFTQFPQVFELFAELLEFVFQLFLLLCKALGTIGLIGIFLTASLICGIVPGLIAPAVFLFSFAVTCLPVIRLFIGGKIFCLFQERSEQQTSE